MIKFRMMFTCLLLVILMVSGCSSGSSLNDKVKTLTLCSAAPSWWAI
ncbi:hypothetical protein J34TS1_03790 [Paenibacillus azoreducens]|uniref:ABC transporter substrate-binding protein n=1 Tax=Paenibacillus azoreducens TaxID=116718 RepID=A0A919Y875_9BACL|nr:hypothetical protein J34TS1_03790 [Paenibacillus azoreducens]